MFRIVDAQGERCGVAVDDEDRRRKQATAVAAGAGGSLQCLDQAQRKGSLGFSEGLEAGIQHRGGRQQVTCDYDVGGFARAGKGDALLTGEGRRITIRVERRHLAMIAPAILTGEFCHGLRGGQPLFHEIERACSPERRRQRTLRRGHPRFGIAAQNPSADAKTAGCGRAAVTARFFAEGEYRDRHFSASLTMGLNLS